MCRRGSNHPFTGASEHAPPLPAEVQAQRWAEDYDSYKVSFLSLSDLFFSLCIAKGNQTREECRSAKGRSPMSGRAAL